MNALLSAAVALAIPQSPYAVDDDPEGWTDLIEAAGPSLDGWTRVPIPPDAELNAESQWSVDPEAGLLVCSGEGGHEWLRWDEEVADGTYRVEWRFVPVEGGPERYNSGVYVRNSADGALWHQAQTGDASGGYLFGQTLVDGSPGRFGAGDRQAANGVNPAGEWNTYEITFDGPRVTLEVNGEVTADWESCEVPSGHVGVEAEGYRIEFRAIRLKAR